MTVDRYLKGVLTVIAGALVWIAIQLSVGTATAQSRPPREPAASQEGAVRDVAVVWPPAVNREGAAFSAQDERNDRLPYVPVYCVNGR
jgi:hypothetical protein